MPNDLHFMHAALAIGRRGLGRTAPNPSVGALVVKDGRILGRGCTATGGRPHAETIALAQAGERARGATIYVTLEPCSHQGSTGPCCEAIVAAGIARLVYALDDPNPLVGGGGAAYCRAQRLEVVGGVGDDLARRDHCGHIRVMTRQRPMVTLKLAETADGFVAGGPHDMRLTITGLAANGAVHVMRALHDAVMVGVGTVLADDPLMTVRLPGLEARRLRVVLDPQARTSPRARLMMTAAGAPILILVGTDAPRERIEALAAIPNVEVAPVPLQLNGKLDLAAALGELARRGITRVFSEGGPTVGSALIAAGFADEVLIFTAPRPLGSDGVPTLDRAARGRLTDPAHYRLAETSAFGVDRLRRYEAIA